MRISDWSSDVCSSDLMLLIRAHGNHFAARPVDAGVEGRLDKDFLTLRMPERTFGAVTLHLGKEAGVWASRMRAVSGRSARTNEAAPARSPTRPPTRSDEGRVGQACVRTGNSRWLPVTQKKKR